MSTPTEPKPRARFVVMYDLPSDVEAFERHYWDVHIPLAKQLPGLRRYTVSRDAKPVIGEPYYLVGMLDWDDVDALGQSFESEIGRQCATDVAILGRYATIRSMVVQLDEA
ncbi:MAG: ethyl tert-butyl ether degradation protein EthD [Nocardia sp.]|uniref:EthD family reductase n=1 Tax=Nocardia sp. TaxID=1821 RepID=UPI0026179D55|nr:EthD family reductase [Nocardia sp.]MCU1642448.1 ethyl tert-butyl ether degradation protein EthD [Nocardia sp.]